MTVRDQDITELIRRCREETQRFVRGEPRDDAYCFALFQRAVVDRDDDAWAAIMAQYRGIVLAYVGQHSIAAMLPEPDEYWLNRAFLRFWSAVGPERFDQFHDLAGLLKYLKLCVHSVLVDHARARRANMAVSIADLPDSAFAPDSAEPTVVANMAAEQLWSTIARQLNDEPERVVAYQSFARDLKPSEIFGRFPELYASVDDVYRIKRNIIDRLRRSPEVRAFLTS